MFSYHTILHSSIMGWLPMRLNFPSPPACLPRTMICPAGTARQGHFYGPHLGNWHHAAMYPAFILAGAFRGRARGTAGGAVRNGLTRCGAAGLGAGARFAAWANSLWRLCHEIRELQCHLWPRRGDHADPHVGLLGRMDYPAGGLLLRGGGRGSPGRRDYSNHCMKFQFAEIITVTTRTAAMNPRTAEKAAESRIMRMSGSCGSLAGSVMRG